MSFWLSQFVSGIRSLWPGSGWQSLHSPDAEPGYPAGPRQNLKSELLPKYLAEENFKRVTVNEPSFFPVVLKYLLSLTPKRKSPTLISTSCYLCASRRTNPSAFAIDHWSTNTAIFGILLNRNRAVVRKKPYFPRFDFFNFFSLSPIDSFVLGEKNGEGDFE